MAFDFSDKVLLAPMAGVTDRAFRQLCIEQGCDLAYTEMVSSKALSYANEKTRDLLTLAPIEHRIGVQLFGHEPHTMAEEARLVEEELQDKLACIDINMGCPARKIVSKGDGSALMKDPDRAFALAYAVVKAVDVPVTIKCRRGWALGEETAPDFARQLEQAGISAITIHGRFTEQLYQGNADWGVIARVKEAVSIPVIGNGDVVSGKTAVELFEQTGCDAIMIGRGAQGNPWIFAEIKAALLQKNDYTYPTALKRLKMARRHAQLLAGVNARSVVRMRKHACWYVQGLPGASKARNAFNHCTTVDDFMVVFDELEQHAASSL